MSDQSKWKDRGEVYAGMGRTDNDKAGGNYWGKNRRRKSTFEKFNWKEKILIKQEGIAEGRLEGKLEEKQELTRKLSKKFSIEQIAEMLEIDISEVEKIIKEIAKWSSQKNK